MMRTIRLVIMPLLVGVSAAAIFAYHQKTDDFSQFFADFQSAVKADDKEKVAGMIKFASFTWEETESLRKMKTKESFLTNYNKMFTKTIRAKIATARPEKNEEGDYFITWHTKDQEYSLAFERQTDGSYRFTGLSVGPY